MISQSNVATEPSQVMAFQPALGNEPQNLAWLVIAHDDAGLLRRLPDVMDPMAMATLPVNQTDWDFEGDDMQETLHWCREEADVKNLMLIGHSAGIEGDAGSETASSASAQSSLDRLMNGGSRVKNRVRESKSDFAARVDQLASVSEVRDAVAAGELTLHAYFFLAECGSFLHYDLQSQTFSPVESDAA